MTDTTQQTHDAAPQQNRLTDAELRATIYFSIGVGSEGSVAGRDVSHELRFAGNINQQTRVMDPVGNSGYSLGTLQTDFGQHPEAGAALVGAYQRWARAHATERAGWALDAPHETQLITELTRTGKQIEGPNQRSTDDNGLDIDPVVKSRLNAFLQTSDGITFVHDRDSGQVDHLMRTGAPQKPAGLQSLQDTDVYRNASQDDQVRLATIIAKLENQAGRGHYPGIITRIERGELNNVAQVTQAVDGLLPNGPRNSPDYVESGCAHALQASEVLIALRNAHPDNPLHAAWQTAVAEPLANPVTLQGQAASHYDTVKSLFLQPHQATEFVHALDQGGTYSWPHTAPRQGTSAGYFAAGDAFVMWNRDGHGHAFVDGQWRDIERQNITRVDHRDGTIDLSISENGTSRTLLHIDPNAPNVARRPRGGTDVPAETAPAQQPQSTPLSSDMPQRSDALSAPQRILLDSPAHHSHEMYVALLEVVHARDRALAREPDEFSRQLAASLTAQARERGLDSIGYAAFSPDGRTVGMTDTRDPSAPWAKTAAGNVAELAMQSFSESTRAVDQHYLRQTQQQSLQAESQTAGIDSPAVRTSPRVTC